MYVPAPGLFLTSFLPLLRSFPPIFPLLFPLLLTAVPMMASVDLASLKRTFILIPNDDAYKPYEKFMNPVNVSFALNTLPLLSYHYPITSVSQLYRAAPARYKTEKIKPLLIIEKTAFSTKGTYKDVVYFGTTRGAKQAKVLRLIKAYPTCLTAFQTNKLLIPPNYKV